MILKQLIRFKQHQQQRNQIEVIYRKCCRKLRQTFIVKESFRRWPIISTAIYNVITMQPLIILNNREQLWQKVTCSMSIFIDQIVTLSQEQTTFFCLLHVIPWLVNKRESPKKNHSFTVFPFLAFQNCKKQYKIYFSNMKKHKTLCDIKAFFFFFFF